MAGSSPLTRGKPGACRARRSPVRLIPAHAGKTPGSARCGAPHPAHPRSRGENPLMGPDPLTAFGSSPLTRGKQLVAHHVHVRVRLIPAHAGKTRAAMTAPARRTAHPRSRGENGAGRW